MDIGQGRNSGLPLCHRFPMRPVLPVPGAAEPGLWDGTQTHPHHFLFTPQPHWGKGRRQAQSIPNFKTDALRFHHHHNSVHRYFYLFISLLEEKNKEKQREKRQKNPPKPTSKPHSLKPHEAHEKYTRWVMAHLP